MPLPQDQVMPERYGKRALHLIRSPGESKTRLACRYGRDAKALGLSPRSKSRKLIVCGAVAGRYG